MTMSIPCVADDTPSTVTPSDVRSFPYPPPVLEAGRSAVSRSRHRYSLPLTASPSPRHSLSGAGVAKLSFPVKNYLKKVGSRQLKVTGSRAPQSGDDVTPDMTSSDADEYISDVGDSAVERPSVVSAMRRKLDSAHVFANSPVNSTGVHIIIDAETE